MRRGQNFFVTVSAIVVFLSVLKGEGYTVETEKKPAILVFGSGGGTQFLIDPVLENKLKSKGYRVASLYDDDLTKEKMNLFNIAVMLQEPIYMPDEPDKVEVFKKTTKDLILNYVNSGGGLLIFFDEFHYTEEWNFTLNHLLKNLGAEVSQEQYNERDKSNIHAFSSLHDWITVYKTDNIISNNITDGVKEFWYPAMSGVMKLDKEWEILVKGSTSAYTAKSYDSAPPLLAVRKYGKGRIALFMGHSSFYVNNGYHRAYEQGWCFEKGDGMRLFENLFLWLSEPTKENKEIGNYKDGMLPALEQKGGFQIKEWNVLDKLKPFPGIIGVYTTYSGGINTVQEFVEKAKQSGLKYIAFTDRIKTKEDWEKLKADCEKYSDDTIVAIPGVEFKDAIGNIGYAVNIDKWPLDIGIGNTNFIMTLLTAGEKHPGMFVLTQPKENPMFPWNLGGFNCLEIISYKGSEVFTAAMDWLKEMQAIPGFSLLPVVSHRVWSLDQLDNASKEGFKTYLYAGNVPDIRLRTSWDFVPGFVSNGPVIEEFWPENMKIDAWEHYLLWQPGDIVKIHIKINSINSGVNLSEIELYSGRKLIRNFYPSDNVFSTIVEYPISQEGPFYIIVKDSVGKIAVSYAIPTRNLNYWNHVGADKMNDYHNPISPDKSGMIIYNGQRFGFGGLITFGFGWGSYLHLYHPVPSEAYHPQGYETGQIVAGVDNVRAFPRILSEETEKEGNVVVRRDHLLDTRDIAIERERADHYFDDKQNQTFPTKFTESDTQIDMWRYAYRPYGYIILDIDQKSKIISTINLHKLDNNIEIILLEIGYKGKSKIDKCTYTNKEGKLVTIDYPDKDKTTIFSIPKNGFVTLHPDPFGLVAIYNLGDSDNPEQDVLDVEIGGDSVPYIRVGYDKGEDKLLKGKEFHHKFIVVEEGAGQEPALWQILAKLWGLTSEKSSAVPQMFSGEYVGTEYATNLNAKQGGVSVKFTNPNITLPVDTTDLMDKNGQFVPNNILPIVVRNINENWSAGALSVEKEKIIFYSGGTYNQKLYIGLDQDWLGKQIFIGNPLIADKKEVMIEIQELTKSNIKYCVYNPTKETISVKIQPAIDTKLKHFIREITLNPNETKIFIEK